MHLCCLTHTHMHTHIHIHTHAHTHTHTLKRTYIHTLKRTYLLLTQFVRNADQLSIQLSIGCPDAGLQAGGALGGSQLRVQTCAGGRCARRIAAVWASMCVCAYLRVYMCVVLNCMHACAYMCVHACVHVSVYFVHCPPEGRHGVRKRKPLAKK